jgi:predicted dehydrogenase
VQAPLAVRAAEAGRHLLLEKPTGLTLDEADAVARAVAAAGVASVVFFTWRFEETTATWLQQSARTILAGGAGTWLSSLAGTPFDDSPWRKQYGALWDIGPHLLSVLIPTLGPVRGVLAGRGVRDIVHVICEHDGGRASTFTVSHTVAPLSAGIEVFVHGDAGRLVLLPESGPAVGPFRVAVSELIDAATAHGTHPCDAGFGRDVVAVLAAAQRALETGCRAAVN